MSRWLFLLKHLSYSPANPLDSFHTWRESTDPTFSNSLDNFTRAHSFQIDRLLLAFASDGIFGEDNTTTVDHYTLFHGLKI